MFESNDNNKSDLKSIVNIAMADAIFEGITDYGFMHSSNFINEAVTVSTKMALPSIFEYLESRMQPVNHCFTKKTEHGLTSKLTKKAPSIGEYALLDT